MTTESPPRVSLSGDRVGAYVVVEERADGSMVIAPDRSGTRAPGSQDTHDAHPLIALLRPGRQVQRPTHEVLADWGVPLLGAERLVEFALADVGKRQGFVLLTTERIVYLVRGRAGLEPVFERPRSALSTVELTHRRRRTQLAVTWPDGESLILAGPDRAALERVEAELRQPGIGPRGADG